MTTKGQLLDAPDHFVCPHGFKIGYACWWCKGPAMYPTDFFDIEFLEERRDHAGWCAADLKREFNKTQKLCRHGQNVTRDKCYSCKFDLEDGNPGELSMISPRRAPTIEP